MRGRKPKPTALADLHGRPRMRSAKTSARVSAIESGLSLGIEPPADLTENQLAIWAYAIRHAPPGVLRAIDWSVLTGWVVACDYHQQARAAQAKEPGLLITLPSGAVVNSPYIGIVNRQMLLLTKAAAELGFTPASRPRVLAGLGLSGGPPPAQPNTGITGQPTRSLDAYLADDDDHAIN